MVNELNNFFDKIFLITIKRNKNRVDQFLRNNPTLAIEVFCGIDGKELFPDLDYVSQFPMEFFLQNELSYDRCRIWNKGQLGCNMSNLLLQKSIIENKLKKVLILEDDAYLIEDKLKMFALAIKELPKDWDLLYLGYTPPSKWSESPLSLFFLRIKHLIKPTLTSGMRSNQFLDKRYFSFPFSKHLKRPGVYFGTHAYALSYEGAKKIVTIDTPLKLGADITLMFANYHKLINSFALKDPLFIPNKKFDTSLIN